MNDKNKQILEQYSSRKQTTEEIDELAEAANDGNYRALVTYREKKGGARFHLINRKGHIFGCGYAYLLGWFFLPPETLTIYTTTHRFTLSGDNLHLVEEALLREKVLQLREFDPTKDTTPANGLPVIKHLHVQSTFSEQTKE